MNTPLSPSASKETSGSLPININDSNIISNTQIIKHSIVQIANPPNIIIDQFHKGEPIILPPRISEAQMASAAQKLFSIQIQNLLETSQNIAQKSSSQLKENQELWHKNIIAPLHLKKDSKENEFHELKPKDFTNLQFKALMYPKEIPEQIWKSIPNKHFESQNYFCLNPPEEFYDWKDKRDEKQKEESFSFELIKNNFKGLKYLNSSIDYKKIIYEINKLETQNWTKTIYEEDILPPPPKEEKNIIYEKQKPVIINLKEEQIQKLKNLREIIFRNQKAGSKAFKETFGIGEILRNTKTIKNILEDPYYLQKNLLEPTKTNLEKALKSISPEIAIQKVLDKFKSDIKDLLNTSCDLQKSLLIDIENNTQDMELSKKNFLKTIAKKLLDQIIQSVEISTGKQIIDDYGELVSESESPLGDFPHKNNLSKEDKKLYEQFLNQLNSDSKINFASLSPIIEKMQNGIFKSTNQNLIKNTSLNTPSDICIIKKIMQDPSLELAKYAKQAFDEIFEEESEKYNLLNMQLGFIPFEIEPNKQKKLEAILNTPKFQEVFKNTKFKNPQFSPALISRIKYLHYNLFQDKKQKMQNSLNL